MRPAAKILVGCVNAESKLFPPMNPISEVSPSHNNLSAYLPANIELSIAVIHKGDTSTLPAGTRNTRLNLSESTTKAIFETCKARNISVLAAVHASVAATTYAGAAAQSRDKQYTSTMRFGLRPHLPEPYGTSRFASGLYTGGYMIAVPASQSWVQNAEVYNEEYRRGVTKDFLLTRREYALKVQELMRKPAPSSGNPATMPPSEVDISSVGDAELLVSPVHKCGDGELVIQDVSIGVETLTRQMYCFFWTFRNKIELSLVYNEAYYDAGFAAGLLHELRRVLEKEVAVSWQFVEPREYV